MALRAIADIEADIVSAETRLRSLRIERQRARKARFAARDAAIVGDILAGVDRRDVCQRHRISYAVLCNVWHAHRRTRSM